jgi:xanthine dehydrogenase accessory factor
MEETKGQSPSQQITKAITRLLDAGSIGAVVTVISGSDTVGSKLLIEGSGATLGSSGSEQLDKLIATRAMLFLESRDETRMLAAGEFASGVSSPDILLLFERIQPLPRLIVCGAGHVGAALARLGDFVGYHTTLIDDRAEFVRPDRFAGTNVELLLAEDWTASVRNAIGNGTGVAVAVVTRGHNQDEECMEAIMGTSTDYVGLIGSKRRTNIVLENLRRNGVSEAELQNIRAPIGLDIGAVSPEEVALAIISEIVAERRGGKGGSLSAWRRKTSDML